MGFMLPDLLRKCYVLIGNGGFGPGYGLIGISGSALSDFGTLGDTYHQLKSDQEAVGNQWPQAVIPICSWGGNIFSCVDCSTAQGQMLVFEDFKLWPQDYCLEEFFEMWLRDEDILSHGDAYGEVKVEIDNPFSGTKGTVHSRKRK